MQNYQSTCTIWYHFSIQLEYWFVPVQNKPESTAMLSRVNQTDSKSVRNNRTESKLDEIKRNQLQVRYQSTCNQTRIKDFICTCVKQKGQCNTQTRVRRKTRWLLLRNSVASGDYWKLGCELDRCTALFRLYPSVKLIPILKSFARLLSFKFRLLPFHWTSAIKLISILARPFVFRVSTFPIPFDFAKKKKNVQTSPFH